MIERISMKPQSQTRFMGMPNAAISDPLSPRDAYTSIIDKNKGILDQQARLIEQAAKPENTGEKLDKQA